ncbi:MAG: hypothetical protein Q7K26_02570 [bacterium]|nr:hypothetical protein [bacterium]
MAKYRINIPFLLRKVCGEIEENLRISLGVPMNAELPESSDELSEGTATIHFPGRHFVAKVETGRGHFGQYLIVKSVRCSICFWSREAAEVFMAELQRFAGKVEWAWNEDGFGRRAAFVLQGDSWLFLDVTAANRRNGLPVYEAVDPDHPIRKAREEAARVN